MHNLLITVSVFVSVMPFIICHVKPAQKEKIHPYCTVWVIAAAKKVIYVELGDRSRKMGISCSSNNHFISEGASWLCKIYRGFQALEMII